MLYSAGLLLPRKELRPLSLFDVIDRLANVLGWQLSRALKFTYGKETGLALRH